MKYAFDDFINRKFYKIFCFVCSLIALISFVYLAVSFLSFKSCYFTSIAYDDSYGRGVLLETAFINQGPLFAFLYYAFLIISLVFVISLLSVVLSSLFIEYRKLIHHTLMFSLSLLIILQIIESISYLALDLEAVYDDGALIFLFRRLLVSPFIYLSGSLIFTCVFLPYFYAAQFSYFKKKYQILLVYLISFLSGILLLSPHLANFIDIIFLSPNQYITFDVLATFILLLFAVFGVISNSITKIRPLKFKIPIIIVLTILVYVPLVVVCWFEFENIVLINVFTYFIVLFLPACPMGIANIVGYFYFK